MNQMGGYGSNYDYSETPDVLNKSVEEYNKLLRRIYEVKEIPAELKYPFGKIVETKKKLPIVICQDVTGSLGEFPIKVLYKKSCVMIGELMFALPDPLKDEVEISYSSFGDANIPPDKGDILPLQITDFAIGAELDFNINLIYMEGEGHAATESYGMAAYYYAKYSNLPNAMTERTRIDDYYIPKPLFFFITDARFYKTISGKQRKRILHEKDEDYSSYEAFEALAKKYEVFMLWIGSEFSEMMSMIPRNHNILIHTSKSNLAPDILVGIIAKQTGRYDKFRRRLKLRQKSDQYDQLTTILDRVPPL